MKIERRMERATSRRFISHYTLNFGHVEWIVVCYTTTDPSRARIAIPGNGMYTPPPRIRCHRLQHLDQVSPMAMFGCSYIETIQDSPRRTRYPTKVSILLLTIVADERLGTGADERVPTAANRNAKMLAL
jgi:hypothetical protein